MKNKYRSIAVALTVVLMLALLAGCGNGGAGPTPPPANEAAEAAGKYTIYSMTMDGETYDNEIIEEAGVDYYVVLNADNTVLVNTDDVIEGTWGNGKITYVEDGEEYYNTYELDGDYLTVDASADGTDMVLVFKREN